MTVLYPMTNKGKQLYHISNMALKLYSDKQICKCFINMCKRLCNKTCCKSKWILDFPGGVVDESLSTSAEDVGSIAGPGGFHTHSSN